MCTTQAELQGVSAGLKGQATTLAAVFPRLEGVYLKYLQYDVDWQGWADAAVRFAGAGVVKLMRTLIAP
jgi:hypothetical protein